MGKEKASGDGRARHWWFFVYPDSAPSEWREILDDLHIEWIESPLHDKDTEATGEIKKAHWHILVMFDSLKSYEQIKAITDSLNSPIPQRVLSAKGAVRYFAHLDNPDKYQYPVSEIIAHGGADVAELLKPTAAARYDLIAEMIDWVDANSIAHFIDLLNHARRERRDDWFPILCDNGAFIMREAVKSVWQRGQRGGVDNA